MTSWYRLWIHRSATGIYTRKRYTKDCSFWISDLGLLSYHGPKYPIRTISRYRSILAKQIQVQPPTTPALVLLNPWPFPPPVPGAVRDAVSDAVSDAVLGSPDPGYFFSQSNLVFSGSQLEGAPGLPP
jgi:hypothetical protein